MKKVKEEEIVINELKMKYESLGAEDRKRLVREMCAENQEMVSFIHKFFPSFFMEAFPQ